MEFRLGVLVIGSLYWDQQNDRNIWRRSLDCEQAMPVKVPIRYGRKSKEDGDRRGTYTMVFSVGIDSTDRVGRGIILPYKSTVSTSQEFTDLAISLSKAEMIDRQGCTISKPWGCVAIAINESMASDKKSRLTSMWKDCILQHAPLNQRPHMPAFSNESEPKSITDDLMMNFDTKAIFQICNLDAILATINGIKYEDETVARYPTVKQIAKSIYDADYYDYFLLNRHNGLTTFQDRQIARTLKRKYKVSLDTKRKECIK